MLVADADLAARAREHSGAGVRRPWAHWAAPTSFLAISTASGALFAIPVGADLLGPFGGHRCASHHDDDLFTEPRGHELLDDRLLVGHRRREQCGQADDRGFHLVDGLDDPVGADVLAHVVHVEAARTQHGAHHVLAQVVQVALHGGQQYQGVRFGIGVLLRQQHRLDDRVARFEDLRGSDHLRQEHLAAFPHLA